MVSWFATPVFPDEEQTRKARLLMTVVRTMLVMGSVGGVISFFDPANSRLVWAGFYGGTFLITLALARLVQKGRLEVTAWVVSMYFWVLIALVTLFFGGMKGENAAVFSVSIMLIGTVVGGQAAIGLAIVSVAWCAFIVVLELNGALPPQLGPYTPLNAWTAVTVTLILMSVLLRNSLESLHTLHEQATRAAAERDAALRRSIQAQKLELVGRITSGIAHDLNNLLTVITHSAAFLRAQPTDSPERQLALQDLDGAAERAALMTRQLLSFGRVRVGEREPLSLAAAVQQFEPMLRRLLVGTVRLELHLEDSGAVLADRGGLEQVLLNLAVNGIEAMPTGGTLRVRVRRHEDRLLLEVEDEGVGIDEATRARMFEPFFTTKRLGTGLGLATVKEIVDRLQGAIEVSSTPGRGSVFRVAFPAVGEPAPRAAPAAPEARPTASRALLVEDDPLVRRALGRVLGALGFEVVMVESAAEALAVLGHGTNFEVVVSDISMPGMKGDELAQVLAEQRPLLPVVLMSGNQEPAAEVLQRPRRAFVAKPTSGAELGAAIKLVTRPG